MGNKDGSLLGLYYDSVTNNTGQAGTEKPRISQCLGIVLGSNMGQSSGQYDLVLFVVIRATERVPVSQMSHSPQPAVYLCQSVGGLLCILFTSH